MKLTEIMIIKNGDTENRLKLFQVDDDTMSKLTRIRGSLYEDNLRLKLARDIPTPEPKTELSPEMQARAEAAYQSYMITKNKPVMPVVQPQPMSFDEQIKHDWRFNPGIRKEFVSYNSFLAYKKAEKAGKVKCYGKA